MEKATNKSKTQPPRHQLLDQPLHRQVTRPTEPTKTLKIFRTQPPMNQNQPLPNLIMSQLTNFFSASTSTQPTTDLINNEPASSSTQATAKPPNDKPESSSTSTQPTTDPTNNEPDASTANDMGVADEQENASSTNKESVSASSSVDNEVVVLPGAPEVQVLDVR